MAFSFLFPGQGSQYTGMFKEHFEEFDEFQENLSIAEEFYKEDLGLSQVTYRKRFILAINKLRKQSQQFDKENDNNKLNDNQNGQEIEKDHIFKTPVAISKEEEDAFNRIHLQNIKGGKTKKFDLSKF